MVEGGNIDINARDVNKTTALHIAAKSGNPEIVEFLLEHGADIRLKDYKGRNALDAAIDKDQRLSIISILKSSSWKEALRTATARTNKWTNVTKLDTPMRRLIEKFPEEAAMVLDRCYKETKSGDDISVEMNWEFIEDTFNYKRLDKSDIIVAKWRWNKLFDFDNKDGIYEHITEHKSYDAENAEDTFSEPYTKDFQLRMRNHPLMKMVGHNRTELLNHPLCLSLVR